MAPAQGLVALRCGDGGGFGCEAWVHRYNGPADGLDDAGALALSPDGTRLFVTGHSLGQESFDAATLAHDAATGAPRWAARYDGFDGQFDEGTALALAPDGASVYLAAYGVGDGTADDMVAVAYDAATGAARWAVRHDGPASFQDRALAVAVSPGGGRVFLGGLASGDGTSWDATVLALDAATGDRAWLAALDGPGQGEDRVHALAVSPDGARVFLGAVSQGLEPTNDLLAAALDAATGATLWERRFPGFHGLEDRGVGLAVAPSGGAVFVAGTTAHGEHSDFLTAALDAGTGAVRWLAVQDQGLGSLDKPAALALTPDGGLVVVTGSSAAKGRYEDYLTVAYDAATGARAWLAVHDGPALRDDRANAVAASPDGALVAVAGESLGLPPAGVHVNPLGVGVGAAQDYATLLYRAADGALVWEARYGGPGNGPDRARGVAFTPDGARLLVTGHSYGGALGYDYATMAYDVPRPD